MEEVQKLSNPRVLLSVVCENQWQDITQTECKLMTVIQFFK
jgi:hypothetical protein